MVEQTPYAISGEVTLDGSAVQGARIWAMDISEGTFKYRDEDISLVFTNSDGEYIIDIANITSNYSDGDTVRVYCQVGEISTYEDVTVDTQTGASTQDFTLTRTSGLNDGLDDSLDSSNKYGLKKQGTGMKDGLKDELT